MENQIIKTGCQCGGLTIRYRDGLFLMIMGVLWLLLGSLGQTASAESGVWQDVGSQVKITLSNPVRSPRSKDATVSVQLTNSGAAITGPLRLVIGGVSPANKVSIGSPGGQTSAGEPYLTLNGGNDFAAKASATVKLTVLGGGSTIFSITPRVEQHVNPLTVKITSPDSLITVGRTPVTVQGIVSDPAANLTLNGATVKPGGDGGFSAYVSLKQGHNTIIADAKNATGKEVTDSISVSLDMTPPYVTVESPKDGDTVYVPKINVSGLVNDIVRGTVSEGQANVTVNGKTASVANRSYSATDVPLNVGLNTIEVDAADQEGNTSKIVVKVTYQVPGSKHIELVSGDQQTATINTALPNPLRVKLLDETGKAVSGNNVVFRVTQGDGVLTGGADEGQGILVQTANDGIASVPFSVGTRSGQGNNRVRATAVGFDGEVNFAENATQGAGNKVSINSGNNQRGATGQPLPLPLVVVVTDAGSNVVPNASVQFDMAQGSGKFQNDKTSYITQTDSDGRATAQMTLGKETGLDQQRATATLVGTAFYAGFTASGFTSGAPGNTSISGLVLDNQDTPLPKVTVRVEGTTRQAQTDAQGKFLIDNAPVGPVHLIVDGSTTSVPGEWPTLPYSLVTIAGVENPLSAPVHLVKLDTANAVVVGDKDVDVTLKAVPGFKLSVKAGSVTFPDGSKVGKLSVTPVNADKVPMPPPNGMQPQFIVTIQPVGTRFDPPAQLTLPNVDGHKPGAQVEMYSFDHDLEEFVAIGVGTVSADGSVIASNPGVGVIKAGWHCGSQPGGSGCTHNCPECASCDASCTCYWDNTKTPTSITDTSGDCKKPGCQNGPTQVANDNDPPPDTTKGDCKKPGCKAGAVDQTVADTSDVPPDTTKGDCKKPGCKGNTVDPAVADPSDNPDPAAAPDNVCKKCDNSGNIVADPAKNGSIPSVTDKCCFDGHQLPMLNNAYDKLIAECPNRTQVPDSTRLHEIDGCSGGLTSNIQDPMRGNYGAAWLGQASTEFGIAQGTAPFQIPSASAALDLPCNQHDICYQTCGSDKGVCDEDMRTRMRSVCATAYPATCPAGLTTAQCNGNNGYFEQRNKCSIDTFSYANEYFDGLWLGGGSAYKERQTQYCQCCP